MTLRECAIATSHRVQSMIVPRVRAIHAHDDSFGVEKGPGEAARIAIVEDDYLVAAQVEAALTEAGFEVCGIAGSADEAVALARAERPTLVVMDIRLSGKRDGIDAALELFAAHGIRCIFATAHHDAQVRERAQPARPLAWLAKPYTMPFLIAAVRAALGELHETE